MCYIKVIIYYSNGSLLGELKYVKELSRIILLPTVGAGSHAGPINITVITFLRADMEVRPYGISLVNYILLVGYRRFPPQFQGE